MGSIMGTMSRGTKNYKLKIVPDGKGYYDIQAIPTPSGRLITVAKSLYPKTEAKEMMTRLRKRMGHNAPYSYNEVYQEEI